MAISGLFFILTRMLQVVTLIPIVGMLSYFVHLYVKINALTPTMILVLFIVSVLALAWALATLLLYWTARHSAHVVAAFDLAFVGAFIAGVYLLRGPGTANCTHLDFYANNGGAGVSYSGNKYCAMLKACFALGIIECILFAWSFVSNLKLLCMEMVADLDTLSSSLSSSPDTTPRKSWSVDPTIPRATRTAAAHVEVMNTVAAAAGPGMDREAARRGGHTTFEAMAHCKCWGGKQDIYHSFNSIIQLHSQDIHMCQALLMRVTTDAANGL